MKKTAIYPGTFDPVTLGHMDVIKSGLKIFDNLIIAIAASNQKKPIFSLDNRLEMIKNDINQLEEKNRIKIEIFDGLLVKFLKEHKTNIILRGLRAVSDFEYEFQLANMNLRLDSKAQTVLVPATEQSQFISSRIVKEIARLDGDISKFVSPYVAKKLKNYFEKCR